MKAIVETSRGAFEVTVFCAGCFLLGFIGGQILQAVFL